MSLVTRYRLFWAALMAALLGLAFWKNSQSYPHKSTLWRLGKAVIDTGLVVLMVIYLRGLGWQISFCWIPREQNEECDALSKKIGNTPDSIERFNDRQDNQDHQDNCAQEGFLQGK